MASLDDLLVRHSKRLDDSEAAVFAEIDARTKLAAQFAKARVDSGLTQRALAEKSGIDQAEISRIETANSNPTLATLEALGNALGRSLTLAG